ncbi:uncharacterized protein LOC119422481 [Nematolebias whitei]|uniref:uncharacterized protein LOC119422481 n=1 Tax=Nematolebias whitei TaxID=451745 RepID=UPI001899F74A|nr:uncharacterized protein LOC119422481 [Nematolebias whitei]
MVLIKEEAPEEWRPGVDQTDPEPLDIKEEEEEPWTTLNVKQLNAKEETDDTSFSVTLASLKSEDDEEKPLFSQLHQYQVDDCDLLASSSAGQMEAAADGEDCEGTQTSRNTDVNTHKDSSSSAETELSEEYEEDEDVNNPDSQLKNLSDSGSENEDSDKEWKEIMAPERCKNVPLRYLAEVYSSWSIRFTITLFVSMLEWNKW